MTDANADDGPSLADVGESAVLDAVIAQRPHPVGVHVGPGDDAAVLESMMGQFKLTAREAEVLYWVAKGKTNRDVGDILGASPRTVTKHMEHILPKLGVETRTAAAALVLARVPGFSASRG